MLEGRRLAVCVHTTQVAADCCRRGFRVNPVYRSLTVSTSHAMWISVRHPEPTFISASATVRVPTSADCPAKRQGTQEIRPIFFAANDQAEVRYPVASRAWFGWHYRSRILRISASYSAWEPIQNQMAALSSSTQTARQ